MKIIKILGIAAGLHALALILIFSNPGCSYTKAAGPETSPITPAPLGDQSAPATAPESPTIRYSPRVGARDAARLGRDASYDVHRGQGRQPLEHREGKPDLEGGPCRRQQH